MKTQDRAFLVSGRSQNRVAYHSKARYQVGRELGGHAWLRDVGFGGVCLQVDMPLAVGGHVMIELTSPRGGASAELKGRIAWRRRSATGWFVGVRVYEDESDVRLVLAELICAGLKKQTGIAGLRGRQRVLVDLQLASRPDESAASIWNRLVPAGRWTGARAMVLRF